MTDTTSNEELAEELRRIVKRHERILGAREAIALLLAAERLPVWRPIEEAPKDGTIVFTYWGAVPVLASLFPDGKYHVLILGREGVYGSHGNYAPWMPTCFMPPFPPPAKKG